MIKLVEIQENEIPNFLEIGIQNAPCVLYAIHKGNYALICEEEKCNYDVLKERNVPIARIGGKGATIICAKGDIDFGIVGDKEYCISRLNELEKHISNLLTGGKLINNDFIYNGNKYGSYTAIDIGNYYCIAIHMSNNIDKELIQAVCLKQCFKEPEKLPTPITKKVLKDIFKGE